MVEIEVKPVPQSAAAAISTAAAAMGLEIAVETSLKSLPGSLHWHLRRKGRTGTVEVTWLPSEQRMWVAYHANRLGDGWVKVTAPELATRLAAK